MRFRFIEDRRANYPVTILCDVLGVSPAGYYAWRARPESQRAAANRDLVDDIKRVHRDTSGRYGSPRIHAELRAQGCGVSRGRIERLMRYHGIRARSDHPQRAGMEPLSRGGGAVFAVTYFMFSEPPKCLRILHAEGKSDF